MPKGLPETFMKERYEKNEQFFKVYDQYRPNYKKPIITRKFYSIHDNLDLSKADLKIVENIKICKDRGPKERSNWPVTENQCYAWFSTPLVPRVEKFHYPRVYTQMVNHELRIMMDKTSKRQKFTGIPFKVQ